MLRVTFTKLGKAFFEDENAADNEVLLGDLRAEFGDCATFDTFVREGYIGCSFLLNRDDDENEGWDLNELLDVWVEERGLDMFVVRR